MLPAATVTAGHTPKEQKFLKALFTSLQGEEEIPVPLELLHELFVLQEERDPLVLQVLLPAALLLQGALAPWDEPSWHGLLAPVGALGEEKMAQVSAAPGGFLSSAFCPLCHTAAPPAPLGCCSPEGSLPPLPHSPGQCPAKGTKGDRAAPPLPLGKGDRAEGMDKPTWEPLGAPFAEHRLVQVLNFKPFKWGCGTWCGGTRRVSAESLLYLPSLKSRVCKVLLTKVPA